jgi:hypothetical protein
MPQAPHAPTGRWKNLLLVLTVLGGFLVGAVGAWYYKTWSGRPAHTDPERRPAEQPDRDPNRQGP